MNEGISRPIETNQTGIHDNLEKIVRKHLEHPFAKPYAQHTVDAFNAVDALVKEFAGDVVLDSCCGVGESSAQLAERFPDKLVIGVDKSAVRINRHDAHFEQAGKNYVLVRADLNDFWRMVSDANWPVSHHFILYPNPWPKSKHIKRRWHGAAVFPWIEKIGGILEMRSNWLLYLQEFQAALLIQAHESELSIVDDNNPVTPFERKYQASGQQCHRLLCRFDQ